MAGSFRDLSEAERAHPAVQARIWGSMAEMDEAVFGMTHVLEGFTPTERAKIRETIQSDPDIGMRIAEALDTEASTADVSLQRRTHLRTIAAQLTWRLKNQPIETAIDEYVGKVKKVSARNGYSEELQRKLASQAATGLFIAQAQGQPGAAPAQPGAPVAPGPGAGAAAPQQAYPPGYGPPPGYPPGYGPPPGYPPGYGPPPGYVYAPGGQPYYMVQPPVAAEPRGGAAITVGAILLGLGVIVGAIGFATLDGAGVIAITVGALLLLGGLITLIVGLVLRASST
jgi:hypothetical protein